MSGRTQCLYVLAAPSLLPRALPPALTRPLPNPLDPSGCLRTASVSVLVCLDAMRPRIILESLPPHSSPRESVTHIAGREAPQQQRKAEQDSFSAPCGPLCDY